MSAADRALGMHRSIARRDFLGGAPFAAAMFAGHAAAGEAADTQLPYPPLLHGLRGSHAGSFEAAHALRDGTFWDTAGPPAEDAARYGLVVVGGGISGLAAAHFYRTARPEARVLILDNHDDFGGHARRNEFREGGWLGLMQGGTLDIDSPRPYSPVADSLLRTLGIDPEALEQRCTDKSFYARQGLGNGVFFDRETFGADHLATGVGARPWQAVLQAAPLTDRVRADIVRIYEAKIDYLPGLTSDEKKARLVRMSYLDFLVNIAQADPGACAYFQAMSQDECGIGCDAINALNVWAFGLPGFQGLDLAPGPAAGMGFTAAGYAATSSYKFHFPDGNASIARLLVRLLVPGAVPGSSAEDVVTAEVDYRQLDRPEADVRIRLSSTVVGVRNIGDPAASAGVEIAYTKGGRVFRVHAEGCVLACYNMMIPYLCPAMPQAQKQALAYLVKNPLVYTSVALRNWRAFQKLGIAEVYAPGSYHPFLRLNPQTVIGGYRSVGSPDEPTLVSMVRSPGKPGLDERAQHRIGRGELLATPFETFERNIRDQLQRILGPAGFDAAQDITAITVNRWPHGYAYEYNYLFDPQWPPGQAPHEIGRARFGRIAIANSDAGAAAFTDSAIDQAHRAVRELVSLK